jgi:hypothetical protein
MVCGWWIFSDQAFGEELQKFHFLQSRGQQCYCYLRVFGTEE